MHEMGPATRVAWKIRDIQHRQFVHITGILSRYGLHVGQPRILHTVWEMNGATQRQIAQRLQVSPASLAMSIKRMQRAGLLEKVADENDLRVNMIRLSEKGRRVRKASLQDVIAADERMIAGFSAEEVAQLSAFLERIYQNVDYSEEPADAEKTDPLL